MLLLQFYQYSQLCELKRNEADGWQSGYQKSRHLGISDKFDKVLGSVEEMKKGLPLELSPVSPPLLGKNDEIPEEIIKKRNHITEKIEEYGLEEMNVDKA